MSILSTLTSGKKVDRVLGIDASTNSIAFCLYGKEGPIRWGEVKFKGGNSYDRIFDAASKIPNIFRDFDYDAIVIEPIVYVNNRSTVITLSYSMGAILSGLPRAPVHEYNPMVWQRFIGNEPLSKSDKDRVARENPSRSKSWQQNFARGVRKERTKAWALQSFGISVDSDDVSDAIAVAYTGWMKLNDKQPLHIWSSDPESQNFQ